MTFSRAEPVTASVQRMHDSEDRMLADYGMRTAQSRGRRHPEQQHPYRPAYVRDRDRIIHSSAFRRLMSKTQVFVGQPQDYQRTRLTHTLEVAEAMCDRVAIIAHPQYEQRASQNGRCMYSESGSFTRSDAVCSRARYAASSNAALNSTAVGYEV